MRAGAGPADAGRVQARLPADRAGDAACKQPVDAPTPGVNRQPCRPPPPPPCSPNGSAPLPNEVPNGLWQFSAYIPSSSPRYWLTHTDANPEAFLAPAWNFGAKCAEAEPVKGCVWWGVVSLPPPPLPARLCPPCRLVCGCGDARAGRCLWCLVSPR